MFLCIGATPAAQRVMVFRNVTSDAVNRAITTADGIAGKAINVAKVLKALGADPVAVGFLGGQRGEDIRQALRERGIEQEFVSVPSPTRQCITVIDQQAQTQTELVEESQPVLPEHYEALLEIVRRRMTGSKAAILSGILTPGAPADFYMKCAECANASATLAILDVKGEPLTLALQARPGLVKPNREELAASFGGDLENESAVIAAMKNLHERGAQRVVVTAGKEATLAFDGRTFWRIVPPSVAAVNPIGSGDAFTAALATRLLRGDDLGHACRWGAAAGAANALTLMAGEVEREEVERLAPLVKAETMRA